MIQFNAQFETIEINPELFNMLVKKNLLEQMKIAGQKFLQAALVKIPSFQPPAGGIFSEVSFNFVADSFNNLKQAVGGPYETRSAITKTLAETAKQHMRETGTIRERAQLNRFMKNPSGRSEFRRKINSLVGERLARELERGHESPLRPVQRVRSYTTPGGQIRTVKVSPYYYGSGARQLKSPELARQLATQPNDVFVQTDKGIKFQYAVDITYFTYQESEPGRSPSAPWQAFTAGMEAFTQYMTNPNTIQKIYPDLSFFTRKVIFKIEGDRVTKSYKDYETQRV